MDSILYRLPTNEFTIIFQKEYKDRLFTKDNVFYNKYDCKLIIQNNLYQDILKYTMAEIDFIKLLELLYDFTINISSPTGYVSYIGLDENMTAGYIYFTLIDEYGNLYDWDLGDDIIFDHPTDNDPLVYFNFFEESLNGTKSRINFKLEIYDLEDLVYQMYQLIKDIPYLDQIISSDIIDYL